MKIRIKLADWITKNEVSNYRKTLEQIAAINVTPDSNGTLRKAVRIAREALND